MDRRLQRVIVTLGAACLSLAVAACSGGDSTTPSPTPMSASSTPASVVAPTSTTGMRTIIVGTPTSASSVPAGAVAPTSTTDTRTIIVGTPASAASPGPDAPVTRERAAEIATDRYGGRVFNVEADTEQGHPTWEVEIADSSQGRIEVDVDQSTGEIVKVELD